MLREACTVCNKCCVRPRNIHNSNLIARIRNGCNQSYSLSHTENVGTIQRQLKKTVLLQPFQVYFCSDMKTCILPIYILFGWLSICFCQLIDWVTNWQTNRQIVQVVIRHTILCNLVQVHSLITKVFPSSSFIYWLQNKLSNCVLLIRDPPPLPTDT